MVGVADLYVLAIIEARHYWTLSVESNIGQDRQIGIRPIARDSDI